MKKLRTFSAACVLALVFATAVRADDGYIQTGIVTLPPPPPSAATTANADGYIHTGFTSSNSNDSIVEAALTLIQTVLSLP
jgi:hypothetical protein